MLCRLFYMLSIIVILVVVLAFITNSIFLWRGITMFGDEALFIALTIFIYVMIDNDLGIDVLVILLFAASLNMALKQWLALPRPPPTEWKVSAKGFGFPSGHTQLASAFWGLITLRVHEKRKELAISVFMLSITIVLGVALSRLMLGVHYLRDVLGGALLGFSIAVLYYIIQKWSRESAIIVYSLSSALFAAIGILFLDGVYTMKFFEVLGITLPLPLYVLIRPRLRSTNIRGVVHKVMTFVMMAPSLVLIVLARKTCNPFMVLLLYSVAACMIILAPLLSSEILRRFSYIRETDVKTPH